MNWKKLMNETDVIKINGRGDLVKEILSKIDPTYNLDKCRGDIGDIMVTANVRLHDNQIKIFKTDIKYLRKGDVYGY